MAKKNPPPEPDRVSLEPLDPLTALKALLAVDPDAEPVPEDKRENEPEQADSEPE